MSMTARRLPLFYRYVPSRRPPLDFLSEVDAFAAHIASTWFERGHPAHPIIAAAFGES